MESVTNIRTVASFGREEKILEIFDKTLENPRQKAFKKGNISGLLLGFS
jgi:ATP-binding cassette subfamily B (MDR/TAP) protein 1